MVRTRVGYTGGMSKDPTYHNLANHTESIEIDYNPASISYEALLRMFWQSHRPYRQAWSRQYMSTIFYQNNEQKKIALSLKEEIETEIGHQLFTEIAPLDIFYLAEDYHQKYYLRNSRSLMAEFKKVYPDAGDFTNSTAVARVNGYVGGYGAGDTLKSEIDLLGLSSSGKQALLGMVR